MATRLAKTPLCRFGVVADVQYADNDDKPAWYNPQKTRYYRNSLQQVARAFQYWEKLGQESGFQIGFILQLGDIIDALNTSACSHSAIDRTLSCFLNNPQMPTFHTLGNHELYNFNRKEISFLFDKFLFNNHGSSECPSVLKAIRPSASENQDEGSFPLYYKFSPCKGVKFISLDTYDISVLGYDASNPKYKLAAKILQSYHGDASDMDLWDTDKMLSGADIRFQASNGALSEQQLQWLDDELTESDQLNELVIVYGHVGLHPNSCGWDSLLWNYDQVLECFNRHQSVLAYFNGHAHNSGYAVDNNIHYIVLHGIIETPPEQEAFTTVTLMDDQMVVDGQGVEKTINVVYHKIFSFEVPCDQQDGVVPVVCDEHLPIGGDMFQVNAIKIQV